MVRVWSVLFGCFVRRGAQRVVEQLLDFVVGAAVDFQDQGDSAKGFPLGRRSHAMGDAFEAELLAFGKAQ